MDGSGNNIENPEWGTIWHPDVRASMPAAHYTGPVDPLNPMSPLADPMAGVDPTLPSPRYISHYLFDTVGKDAPTDIFLNQLHPIWGHFVLTDILNSQYSPLVSLPGQAVNFDIPAEDWWFDEQWGATDPAGPPIDCGISSQGLCVKEGASKYISVPLLYAYPWTGAGTQTPKTSYSAMTSWLDLSQNYGNPVNPQSFFVLFPSPPFLEINPTSGRMGNWGKFINVGGPPTGYDVGPNIIPGVSAPFTAAGDFRINKTPGLRVLFLTFMKEHNRQVDLLREANPTWSNETLFQEARRYTIAIYQSITIREYLAAATGLPPTPYTGYDPTVDPGIDHFFAAVAFRYGHSAMAAGFPLFDDNLNPCPYAYMTWNNIFLPSLWESADEEFPWTDPVSGLPTSTIRKKLHVENIIRGLSHSEASKVDLAFADHLRNTLFQNGGPRHGDDLISLDIWRGRELGIPRYNDAREYFGLPRATTWSDITKNKAVQGLLKKLYGNISAVEAYVGAMAEDHEPAVEMGPLNVASLLEQFTRLRNGDRFWFENPDYFTPDEIEAAHTTKLIDVFTRNWDISRNALPISSFFVDIRQLSSFRTASEFPPPMPHPNGLPWGNVNLTDVYKFYWAVDRNTTPGIITFQILVETDGWAGFGWAPDQKGSMKGADIALCRIANDVPECRDSKALDVGLPILDADGGGQNSFTGVTVERKDGILRAMWTRSMSNDSDPEWDNSLGDNTRIIFAFNPITNDLVYHGPTRNPDTIINFEADYLGPLLRVPISRGVTGFLYALCGLGATLSFFFIFLVLAKKEFFRFQTPEFCILINFGALLGYISVLLLLPDSQNNGSCKAHLWFFGMSFWIVFVGFFTKVARVYWIVKRTQETMEVTVLPFYYLFVPLTIFMLAEMVMQICWDTLVPPDLETSIDYQDNTYTLYCAGNKWFWLGSVIWKACFLGIGVLLALETRHMPQELNWSREIAASIYTMAVILAIGIPLGFFLSGSPTMVVLLKGLTICIAYAAVMTIVHLDSLIRIFSGKEPREQTRTGNTINKSSRTGAGQSTTT